MKVLWLSNVLFPELCKELNIVAPVVGGWMYSGAEILINNNPDIKLAVASLYPGKELKCIEKYPITYYLIPNQGDNQIYNPNFEKYYLKISETFQPDIVHIHGSEYPHSLAYVKACGSRKVIVSIQGLVNIYAKHYLGGISENELKKNRTIRDILRKDSLLQQQKKMVNRGNYEIELLKNVQHIIGRTSWDFSNTWSINPKASYHFCNETLRPAFYEKKWKFENCKKYSIFLSQAHYPIKGIQQIIEALPIVLEHYPLTKVYIAGNNFMSMPWYRKNDFTSYIENLMKKNSIIGSQLIFLGLLNEYQMAERYVSSHVFVCPSAIENSPNSVGEAQLVGTPCVASYVGGTMDMVKDGETGFLYRFEETAQLAKHICTLFSDSQLATLISKTARIEALKRHDKDNNAAHLREIYSEINNLNKNILD
jgi:glycosyltransferase involved in cell wall biosynthesis